MKTKSSTAIIAALAFSTTAVFATVFTSNTTIAVGNAAYDGQPIVVSNCTLTVNGPHSFASLQVISNGVVTHTAAPNGEADNHVLLTVLGDVTIAAGGRIDANGRGYTTATGPGAGTYYSGGSGSGAGHGGIGGAPNYGGAGTLGGGYDSILTPSLWGSGGGSGCCGGVGAAGGGAIYLAITGTLQVDGVIAADGASAASPGGCGAGGSIRINAGNLAGGGSISAKGGSTDVSGGGGGGGGRIALNLTVNNFAGAMSAVGGLGYQNGGAGTIYTKLAGDTYGRVLVSNGGIIGQWTPMTNSEPFALVISNQARVYASTALTNQTLTVGTNGLLSCMTGQSNVSLTVLGDATVAMGGRIDVNGQGYAVGAGPAAGIYYSSGSGSGAGHGGMGGIPAGTGTIGNEYDSVFTPSWWGSGGGSGCCGGVGGSGGGAIYLAVTGTLQVDGVIAADGLPAPWPGGGGAGGSIQITAGNLAGGGSISAQGGSTDITGGGGGGGGRIALYIATNGYSGRIIATGGLGYQNGGAGTIYTKLAANAYGKVLVDNGTNAGVTRLNSGSWPAGQVFNLTLSGNAIIKPDSPLTLMNIVLTNGAKLTHDAGQSNVALTVLGDATVAVGGRIDVSGQGYAASAGPGAGIYYTGSGSGSGAGHGGMGGIPAGTGTIGNEYDSVFAPTLWGSGGGTGSFAVGGAGGGAIRLAVAGTLQVDGAIAADGQSAAWPSGGGAGGTIQISSAALTGGGLISAQGGSTDITGGGGGGGGRIALYFVTNNFTGTISTVGGLGYQNGGAGTIYTKLMTDTYGKVLVDNGTNAGVTRLNSGYWPAGQIFNLTLAGAAILKPDGPLTFMNLVLTNSAKLTHDVGQSGFYVTALSNAFIAVNASINVDGLGYGSDTGPGTGSKCSSGAGSGAGHGGAGQASYNFETRPGFPPIVVYGGGIYGSSNAPVTLGSGGGHSDPGGGGAGGGAIRLTVAGTLQLDGVISANGLMGGTFSGSGSGGSIWITADTLNGSGSINALGGAAASYGAAGGGGRIALYTYSKAGFDTNHISAAGAGTGTLVFGYPPPQPNAAVVGSALRLAWHAGNGSSYQVWSSPDLVNWSLYGPVRAGTGDILTQDCPMTNSPALFFRVQLGN